MAMHDDDDDTSFDPKTWTSLQPVSTPATKSQRETDSASANDPSPSFDLRSWGTVAAAPSPPPTSRSPAPAGPEIGDSDAHGGGRRTLYLAGGSGLAILIFGAAVAMFAQRSNVTRQAPPHAAQTADSASASAPAALPPSRRTLVVNGPGEIANALISAGVAPSDATAATAKAVAALGSTLGEIRLSFDIQGIEKQAMLLRFEATHADGSGLALTRLQDGSFAARTMATKLETRIKVIRGELDANSFYTSAVTAGVTDSLIGDFANAFSFDFDMQREVAPGDVFEAAFEQSYNPSGEAVGIPKLIYVSLNTAAKSRALYRFVPPGEKEAGWFDGNGHSTVRALMRTPVDSARISSGFGMRLHPVLGYMKLHKGTDFAAPIGTPIYASGNAVVIWAAMKGPNGNLTVLQHDNGWQTLYLHQRIFMPGIVPGARVSQGQKIGEIGLTGRTTGPHLHYEVHIDGEPVNPLEIDTGTGKTLSGAALTAFNKQRDGVDARRAASTNAQ